MEPESENKRIILTGFGKFQGVAENPTERLVQRLKNEVLDARVIEVSISAADAFHSDLHLPEGTILLHLGVNASGSNFTLECMAYNELNFRVPDENGERPQNQPIDSSAEASIMTSIDVIAMQEALMGKGYDVRVSDDPGRFLCNYLYFKSLQRNLLSLFIHVPPFAVIDEEHQFNFVRECLRYLREHVQPPQND